MWLKGGDNIKNEPASRNIRIGFNKKLNPIVKGFPKIDGQISNGVCGYTGFVFFKNQSVANLVDRNVSQMFNRDGLSNSALQQSEKGAEILKGVAHELTCRRRRCTVSLNRSRFSHFVLIFRVCILLDGEVSTGTAEADNLDGGVRKGFVCAWTSDRSVFYHGVKDNDGNICGTNTGLTLWMEGGAKPNHGGAGLGVRGRAWLRIGLAKVVFEDAIRRLPASAP